MKDQRGSAAVWIIIVLIVIIIAGAAYWYLSQHSSQPTIPSSPTTTLPTQTTYVPPQQNQNSTQTEPVAGDQQTNPAPSATIDQSSLISTTTPRLTGSVTGTSQIAVAVWRGNLSPSQMTPSTNNLPFWSNDTGIRDPEVYVTNGRWYTTIGNSEVAGLGPPVPYFPNGIYTVSVSDFSTGQILASAELKITGPSIEVTNTTASTVTFSYVDLPENSQVLLAGQSNNPPIVATVSGSGSDSISIPGGIQGTYWLQVELNGNANSTLQSGAFSANSVVH